MKVIIREATAEDYAAMCELFDVIDTLHRDRLPDLFQQPSGPPRDRIYYEGLLKAENVGLLVAEAEKEVAGYVHILVNDTPAIPVLVPRRYAVVDNLCVKPTFQRLGIGRRLMDAAHEWAMTKAAESVELNVYVFNEAALTLYKDLGYKPLSQRMSKILK